MRLRTNLVSGLGLQNWFQEVQFACEREVKSKTSLEHCLKHVSRQARIFPQTADGVCIPVASEGNINAQVVAGRPDHIAELLIDTKQHLEFVSSWREFQIANDSKCLPYHQFVVRRDADV